MLIWDYLRFQVIFRMRLNHDIRSYYRSIPIANLAAGIISRQKPSSIVPYQLTGGIKPGVACFFKISPGIARIAFGLIDKPSVVICIHFPGIESDRLSNIFNSLVIIAPFTIGNASNIIRLGILRIQSYRLRIIFDGAVIVAYAAIGNAAVAI